MNRRVAATLLAPLAALALIAGCAPGGTTALDLDGAWVVSWDGGSLLPDFAATGAMTLDVSGGTARFVGLDATSGIKRCMDLDVTLVADAVVLLQTPSLFEDGPETWAFVAQRLGSDAVRLANEVETLTLRRRTGAPPVSECGATSVALVAELPVDPAASMNLQAVGTTLYMNTGFDGVPVVGIDAATGAITSSRTLTDGVVFGSPEPYLFAAESDDRFYGTCRCGRSDRFTHFDLATDTALTQVLTEATGVPLGIRFGIFDASTPAVVLGGTGYDDGAAVANNRLVTLDPVTYAVLATRDVLPNAFLTDITVLDGRLLALIGEGGGFGDVVEVGADGRAVETYALQGAFDGFARGIAAVGDVLYVVTESWSPAVVRLYAVTLD